MNASGHAAATGAGLLLTIGLCFTCLAQAQTEQVRPRQDTALTYNAHQYLQAEQQLEEALSRNAAQAVAQQLAENFTARTAAVASLDKSEWLRLQPSRARQAWILRELNAQMQDDLCIVSFLRVNPQQPRQQQLIVDIWRDSTRQLLNRFEGPLGLGASKPTAIRPDGKG